MISREKVKETTIHLFPKVILKRNKQTTTFLPYLWFFLPFFNLFRSVWDKSQKKGDFHRCAYRVSRLNKDKLYIYGIGRFPILGVSLNYEQTLSKSNVLLSLTREIHGKRWIKIHLITPTVIIRSMISLSSHENNP